MSFAYVVSARIHDLPVFRLRRAWKRPFSQTVMVYFLSYKSRGISELKKCQVNYSLFLINRTKCGPLYELSF